MNSLSQPITISANTRISTVIRANPAAIEAIASINKHFEKLRNPILRKVLASRVTIADAARIGGTDIGVFFDKLQELGFLPERTAGPANNQGTNANDAIPPVARTLDVRKTLEAGEDPFKKILAAAEQLPENQSLLIINTFEPIPLFSVLRKKGFAHYTSQIEPDLVNTYFYRAGLARTEPGKNNKPAPNQNNQNADFKSLLQHYQNHLVTIDVRELEMPLPMITILEKINTLGLGQALLVHHRRVPQYLLPQLTGRGYAFALAEPGPDEVYLLIYKNAGNGPDYN